jgi:plasmid stabilization system protein ParE
VRKILFGQKPHIYAIYFRVKHDDVEILHVRHGARSDRFNV